MGPRLVVVGVPGDKRMHALARALERGGHEPPIVVSWQDVVLDPRVLRRVGRAGDLLRVESPGADLSVWASLSMLGGGAALGGGSVDSLVDGTEWRPRRAWVRGLSRVLTQIERAASHLRPTQRASDLLTMIDKLATAQHLAAHGVRTPNTLEAPSTVEELRARLDAERLRAVFVKSRWGSSGSGVFALRREHGRSGGERERLVTTLRLDGPRAFNDKRVRGYDDRSSIDALLAPVLADGAIVQRWIPKAGADDGPFDLRVLVVHGRVAQRVARVGKSTITNLHLDARRLDVDAALEAFGPGAWPRVVSLCESVAAAFDRRATIGIDVAIDPSGTPWVIECNAWGDYLPGLLHEGEDAYGVQVRALFGARTPASEIDERRA